MIRSSIAYRNQDAAHAKLFNEADALVARDATGTRSKGTLWGNFFDSISLQPELRPIFSQYI